MYLGVSEQIFEKEAHVCVTLADVIIKPPESGELCEEITEFVVAGDHLIVTWN